MVIADPPVKTPSEIGDRLVAFAWAGIHSGEVCGKPATLMLARELITTKDHTLEVTPRVEERTIKAGTPIVRTGQPLGTLTAYLLEPQSEDGFCTWNFLNDELVVGKDIPVLRFPKPVPGL